MLYGYYNPALATNPGETCLYSTPDGGTVGITEVTSTLKATPLPEGLLYVGEVVNCLRPRSFGIGYPDVSGSMTVVDSGFRFSRTYKLHEHVLRREMREETGLVFVDVQRDFITDGKLSVPPLSEKFLADIRKIQFPNPHKHTIISIEEPLPMPIHSGIVEQLLIKLWPTPDKE